MKFLSEIYSRIQFTTILTTGRTGSDYLQACLDNVPGLLTFSDKFFYYNFCNQIGKDIFKKIDSLKILQLFIEKNNELFSKNELENKILNIDIKKFEANFVQICKQEEINRKNFFLALYLAYHITLNRSIENIKTLVHHSHNLEETRNFLNDFGRSKLLVTVRDPRANLKSGIVNWIKYDNARDNQEHFYLYIKRIREDLKFARKQNNQIFFIKLEEANDINLKKKLTKFLNVEFHPAMNVATYAGKKWIGDKLSQHNSQDGSYDKTVRNNQWEDFFSKKDKLVLNFIYKDYQIFGYKINTSGWFDKILIFFTIPLPFSFDKNFFKIKKNIFLNLFFYLKRTIYLYLVFFQLK